jgi:hypothetical protein
LINDSSGKIPSYRDLPWDEYKSLVILKNNCTPQKNTSNSSKLGGPGFIKSQEAEDKEEEGKIIKKTLMMQLFNC